MARAVTDHAESSSDSDVKHQQAAASGGRKILPPVLLALLLYVLFRWVLGSVRLPAHTPGWLLVVAGIITCAGSLGFPILVIGALVRNLRGALPILGAVAFGLALWLGLGALGRPGVLVGSLQDAGKVVAAAALGIGLGSILREPNILLPAGLFAAFADFVVVNFGTVKHALSTPKGQALVQSVSAQVPAVHPALPSLTIGPADFLFLGVFLACTQRFDMGVTRNAVVLGVVLAAALLEVLLIGFPVPALAPMALAFVGLNWRKFRLTRDELIGTILVLVLAGGLFLGYFLLVYSKKG